MLASFLSTRAKTKASRKTCFFRFGGTTLTIGSIAKRKIQAELARKNSLNGCFSARKRNKQYTAESDQIVTLGCVFVISKQCAYQVKICSYPSVVLKHFHQPNRELPSFS